MVVVGTGECVYGQILTGEIFEGTIQHMVKIQEVLLVPQKIRLTRHSVCQLTILNLFYLMTCSKHFLNRQGAIQGIVGMPALEMSLEAFGIT